MLEDILLFDLSPRHVFFMNSCNPDVKDVRLSSTVLCISSCPEEQLDTLEEVQLFANNNGGCKGWSSLFPLRLELRWGDLYRPRRELQPDTASLQSWKLSFLWVTLLVWKQPETFSLEFV